MESFNKLLNNLKMLGSIRDNELICVSKKFNIKRTYSRIPWYTVIVYPLQTWHRTESCIRKIYVHDIPNYIDYLKSGNTSSDKLMDLLMIIEYATIGLSVLRDTYNHMNDDYRYNHMFYILIESYSKSHVKQIKFLMIPPRPVLTRQNGMVDNSTIDDCLSSAKSGTIFS